MAVTVRIAPPDRLPWLAERAQLNLHPGMFAIEAVRGDQTIAMVGFERHYAGAAMVHIALEHPAALRHVLYPLFRLAFDEYPHGLGLAELFCPVRADNERSLALVRKVGFEQFHFGKDWMGPGAGIVWFGLRRERCRFLSKEGA